jgi:hypothetical protein
MNDANWYDFEDLDWMTRRTRRVTSSTALERIIWERIPSESLTSC